MKKIEKIEISPKLLSLMSSIKLPLHIFHNKLTPLEAIIRYLKEECSLSYHEISLMIDRDERNVWKGYHNAKRKYNKKILKNVRDKNGKTGFF